MRKILKRMIAITIFSTLLLAGCSEQTETISSAKLLEKLLNDVTYETELTKVESNEGLYFPDLPEETKIYLYMGSGYFADETAMFVLADSSDKQTVLNVVETHVEELKDQFQNYIPEEVEKIEHAVIVEKDGYVFLCITSDYENANKILNTYDVSADIEDSFEDADENVSESLAEDTQTMEDVAEDVEEEEEYPVLQSKSGVYERYESSVIRVDDAAYEEYAYVDSSAANYANLINQVAGQVEETDVYVIAIPTAIGVVLPDDIKEQVTNNSEQGESIKKVYEKLLDDVIAVDCFDNLMKHRDEYLYFRTDFHWTGRGAYYAYESFCNAKGIDAITLDEREEVQYEGFLGELYWKDTDKNEELGVNPDTVYGYYSKSENVSMVYTTQDGTEISGRIIADVSNSKASLKYMAFAGGDNPITVFENPDITDGSVCVIVKESFGNPMMSYFVDHYSTVYEIDYRYWKGNLADFVNEKQADDLIFANNLSMIRSNYLIGKLNEIIN